ncbi:unnamed protein product [Acanthosepion pharaonis]|uniref:Uncharacterized protein n=1 Tax=Acanthosepion pharaonis TaxID=158019 RepID=A0A812BU55_ACAPH|nr:unnamed protein product [Sepia pharaonis]
MTFSFFFNFCHSFFLKQELDTCHQQIDNQNQKVSQLETELSGCQNQLKELQQKVDEGGEQLIKLGAEYQTVKEEGDRQKAQILEYSNKIAELHSCLDGKGGETSQLQLLLDEKEAKLAEAADQLTKASLMNIDFFVLGYALFSFFFLFFFFPFLFFSLLFSLSFFFLSLSFFSLFLFLSLFFSLSFFSLFLFSLSFFFLSLSFNITHFGESFLCIQAFFTT